MRPLPEHLQPEHLQLEHLQLGLSRGVGPVCLAFQLLVGPLQGAAEAAAAVWRLSRQQGQGGSETERGRGGNDGDPKAGMDGAGERDAGVAQGRTRTGGSLGRVDPDKAMGPPVQPPGALSTSCRREAWAAGSEEAFNRGRGGERWEPGGAPRVELGGLNWTYSSHTAKRRRDPRPLWAPGPGPPAAPSSASRHWAPGRSGLP